MIGCGAAASVGELNRPAERNAERNRCGTVLRANYLTDRSSGVPRVARVARNTASRHWTSPRVTAVAVRVRFSDPGSGAPGHRRGRVRHDLARAVATRRRWRGALRAADQDGGRCAACGDVWVLLESREPRPDHAGRHEVFHRGAGPADGAGSGDRLSRARRSAAGAMAHAHHHVGARSKLCRLSGEGAVPLLRPKG
jgi:hypothetical protein